MQLFSNLTYAEFYARLDALRKVLACPAAGCDACEPWKDQATAVARGWSFEDRVVGGEPVRYWLCPAHRLPDPLKPLEPRIFARLTSDGELSEEATKLAFGGHRLLVLRLGETAGTQLAVVIKDDAKGIQVAGWRASSMSWTMPKFAPPEKILGAPSPRDKRVMAAAQWWPPAYLEKRPKGRRR